MISLRDLIARVSEKKEAFQGLSDGVPYEKKGVLFSEMFFLYLCASSTKIGNILESGRARGQSTLLLSKLFPDKKIMSIEHDPNSPDVDIASKRLKDRNNVELLFGDALKMVPEICQQNDIILIDGPKGFRSLRFAINLLATGKFPMVFIHDTTKGTSERKFLDENVGRVLFSDDLMIASETSSLDEGKVELPSRLQLDGNQGYGFSLACIFYDESENYKLLLLKAVVAGTLHRWFHRKKSKA